MYMSKGKNIKGIFLYFCFFCFNNKVTSCMVVTPHWFGGQQFFNINKNVKQIASLLLKNIFKKQIKNIMPNYNPFNFFSK